MTNRATKKTQSHPERSEVPHQISRCPFGAGKFPTAKYLITNYELFMQNKPNLPNAQMNITSIVTRDYKENQPSSHPKNKPNSNPIGWGCSNERKLCRMCQMRIKYLPFYMGALAY